VVFLFQTDARNEREIQMQAITIIAVIIAWTGLKGLASPGKGMTRRFIITQMKLHITLL
jgi:hypothetical protein